LIEEKPVAVKLKARFGVGFEAHGKLRAQNRFPKPSGGLSCKILHLVREEDATNRTKY